MSDLILICETCRRPVDGDSGSLYVRFGEVNRALAADREWREAHPSGSAIDVVELLTMPDDIHWRTGHYACRIDHAEGCYEIGAPRISTWPQLARWTSHLMGKNWLALSDWDELLRELAGEIPAKRIRALAREAA